MDNEKFGQFVRSMRKEKQMTQQQLADRLHLTDKAVSKWERGLSLPDISMLEQLAKELDVSVVELLCGEKKEDRIGKDTVEELLVDTMSDSLKKEKKERRRWLILLGMVICLAVLTVLYGKTAINFALDRFSESSETAYHTSEFQIVVKREQKPEGCFIYKEPAGQFQSNYHVMEIAYDGSVRELFALEETGMELDRAPLLNMEDDCLYVLFDGMDNEDRTERIYRGGHWGGSPGISTEAVPVRFSVGSGRGGAPAR
ncbi:helix-turn-helix domain-containing protein [Hungatella sp.]|uniref:helix-turn-helix domain-containing protein n=1 Tax=Hungatella sp. TaxID=2613924 RepID=UPI003AB902F5